jgi:hypothetical protein
MDDLHLDPPLILVKRRFTIELQATAEIGEWRAPFVERWRESLEEAGGRPFADPSVQFGPVRSDTMQRQVRVTGMALITPGLADRLDAEAAARDEA